MPSDVTIQRYGSYLRVILPAFEGDWEGVRRAVEFEVENGVDFAEIIAPSFADEESLAEVRALVRRLDERGVDSVVEWEGTVRSFVTTAS